MLSLKEIVTANERLHTVFESAAAVFSGATQGIGLGTLKAFAKHIKKPTAYIIGRNKERFDDELSALEMLNPRGSFIFIEGQVNLVEGIDAVSDQIRGKAAPKSIDFVFMAQGATPIEGRRFTSEGLDEMMALIYYGRMRLVQNLIGIDRLRPQARIMSIAIGAREGKMFEDDLALEKNYSIINMRNQLSTMTTLTFDRLAERNPYMTFIHAFPGRVNTGLFSRSIEGWILWILFAYILEPLIFLGAMSPEDCGERMLAIANEEELCKGSRSVDYDGTASKSKWLEYYRQHANIIDRIWTHTTQVFNEATVSDA